MSTLFGKSLKTVLNVYLPVLPHRCDTWLDPAHPLIIMAPI